MRIILDKKLDFDDVLMAPKQSFLQTRNDVELEREFTFVHSPQKIKCIPIVAANMASVAGIEMAKALGEHRLMTALPKGMNYFSSEIDQRLVFMTVGAENEKITGNPKMICLDVANGYMNKFMDKVERTRSMFPEAIIVAGNVCTAEATERLIFAGADIVKVGIGGGSGCTTRMKTGVGYPQLSAVIECADAAHGLKGQLMSDGGCRVPGDICKAFGAGADFVMLGGMLAGHDESPGKIIEINGEQYKEFYGMSSHLAQERHNGGIRKYRSSEGRQVRIPYRGSVHETILDILGGLRSCCTYCGAETLKELPKRTTFVQVSRQLNDIYAGNANI